MSESLRLPARPSLEQLHKQANDLLRHYRAGDSAAAERLRAVDPNLTGDEVTLADAQFVMAREYGFESWPKLKQHVETLNPPGLEQFERLAADVANAYSSADKDAIREINMHFGTSFVWYHEPEKMHRRLKTWVASENRTPALALEDAKNIVAHAYGFESWASFAASFLARSKARRSGVGSAPPFYQIVHEHNAISVRGPMSKDDWDALAAVIKEQRITHITAGAMTDDGLDRITRLDHIKSLSFDGSMRLSDHGLLHLARLPHLQELEISGYKGILTDRGLVVLRHLRALRQFKMCWQQHVTDAGVAHLASCDHLESVDLMGTPTGDGAIRALAGKAKLHRFHTGRNVSDAGIALLHHLPVFKTWHGGEIRYGLTGFDADPNYLLLDGPFSDAGLAQLDGLDGLFALNFFWHTPSFTAAGLAVLRQLPQLGFLGCDGKRCDDDAMRSIAAIPRLRMLMAQGTVATDAGFEALSRSQTIEYIWGRECPNLEGRGFAALANMPALRGVAVSCKGVDDASLATLPRFPALRELMPMDVPDSGFRHVGRCENLERLTCMYCRDTTDAATGHIAGLRKLKSYYAGETQITDRSLEILAAIPSLEKLEFWSCAGITDAGIAQLVTLPNLREIALDGLPAVSQKAAGFFRPGVRVNYTG